MLFQSKNGTERLNIMRFKVKVKKIELSIPQFGFRVCCDCSRKIEFKMFFQKKFGNKFSVEHGLNGR